MGAIYKPVVAKEEFAGHTFEEIRFAQGLRDSVKEFAQILKGEKQGTNAREFFTRLAKEAEKMVNDGQ